MRYTFLIIFLILTIYIWPISIYCQLNKSIEITVTYMDYISLKDSTVERKLVNITDNGMFWSKPNKMNINIKAKNLISNGKIEVWIEDHIFYTDSNSIHKSCPNQWIPIKVLLNQEIEKGSSSLEFNNIEYNTTGFISSNYFTKLGFRFTVILKEFNRQTSFYYYPIEFDD